MNNLSRMTLKYYYNFSIARMEMNANRLKVRNNFHSFRMLCANWCRCISTWFFFFTHCTIDCHITMQLVAANRYVYQYPRMARDKYVFVFRIIRTSLCFPPWHGQNSDGAVVLSSVRSDATRRETTGWEREQNEQRLSYDGRGPKIFCELYNPRERFVGTRKMSTYKYEAPGI